MNEFSWRKRIWLVILLCSATAAASYAQTFTTLVNFNGTNGSETFSTSLVQATDGRFYGTTTLDGANSFGTVFKITPAGTLTTLHSFAGTDGWAPTAGLIQATNGNFYGTTNGGLGTVFKITPAGTLTTLHSFVGFAGTDGANPNAGLVQATNGAFYGTTQFGGANNLGTVFKITPAGTLTTLHSFNRGGTDGAGPTAGLIQATNGNFYGTTYGGGVNDAGAVFKITPAGIVTTLYSFCAQINCTDGYSPYAGLIQATNGNFYGTTFGGGANDLGTVFKITPAGTLTTLHSFARTDGANPFAGLIQATNGNFYGTTYYGGANDLGTIFEITPAGTLTTLHSFAATEGTYPSAGLVQGTNGTFYGATSFGGTGGAGTIFSLSVSLSHFVKTQPTSGQLGAAVKILGTSLTGTTSVSFDGTSAAFTVVSPSLISTTVPDAATTGQVLVTIPNGTLLSNVAFRVTPVILSFSPQNGPVGTTVVITGQSLTGATVVTFGGVKATSFTVDSYGQITATVPNSAKTGNIVVTTAGGIATSTDTFTVN